MMANIEFNYLYRDASNYKKYSKVIFSNKQSMSLSEISESIRKSAFDKMWFNPEKWNISRLRFDNFDPQLDHEWHEISDIVYAETEVTDVRDIAEFIQQISLFYD